MRSVSGDASRRHCGRVEEGRGCIEALGQRPRFPSPLIKPDVRISRIRLSDGLHGEAVDVDPEPQRIRRFTPSSPKTLSWENAPVPRPWDLDRLAPPSPCHRVFSEDSGSYPALSGSSPITVTSSWSKTYPKSGSFPPPALPGLDGRTTLSDTRSKPTPLRRRRGRYPHPEPGLPRLPVLPFPRAVPTTPADRTGAHVDAFPVRAAFPATLPGRHPHCAFRGLLRLHSRYGPRDRSAAQGGLCHEASTPPVTRRRRSSATRLIDIYLDGTFLHR